MAKKLRSIAHLHIALIFCLMHAPAVDAQNGAAGLESPFSIGFGARAIGMGSAAVAYPDDPSAFYWNPAGMVVIEQHGIELSLTTLFEGTQYNFFGYVYPTMSSGAFGLGIARIGTGGIGQRHWDNGIIIEEGDVGYWWGKLIVAYGVTVFKGLSLGVNLDVNRQVLGSFSTNGIGLDMGVHYALPLEKGILRNVYLGCSVDNVLSPRLKLGAFSETLPVHVRWGLAKAFHLRGGADRWLILFDFEKYKHTKLGYHVGTEYGIGRMVYARMGIDNGETTFGGGLRFKNFQLDYGTSRIGDPTYFPRSHRFSLLFYFGTRIPEKKRLLEERQRAEVQRRTDERLEAERQRRIEDGLRAAQEYFDRGDYFNARLEFTRVLREDPENAEARQMLDLTTARELEYQRERDNALMESTREKEQQRRDNIFVNRKYNEGLEAFEDLDFRRAIEKWEEALERDTDNEQIRNYIEQARAEIENEVNEGLARARQLARQGNISEAYKVLNNANDQSAVNPGLRARVIREIENLDKVVNYLRNYQEGQQREARGDYEGAAESYKKALEYIPSDDRAQEGYRKALARSQSTVKELTGEAKDRYTEGLQLYTEGKYEEAKKAWEEALKIAPNNIRILNAIESAKRKLELYKKKEKDTEKGDV